MDDAARVCVLERGGERDPDPQHVAVGQRAGLDQVGQRRPADELGDEMHGVLVAAGLVERDDRRVAEARSGERLAVGARGDLMVVQLDPLDGDHAVQLLVVGQPDDPEGTVSEAANQPVAPEGESPRSQWALVVRSAVCTTSTVRRSSPAILPYGAGGPR